MYALIYAYVAQLVECSLGKAEVTGSIPVVGSNNISVRTNRTDKYKYHSEKDGIFCCKNPINFIASQSSGF